MKGFLLMIIMLGVSVVSKAQTRIIEKGEVSFERDSTDWVATISEKDSISVLFKMMFQEMPQRPLPPNGTYKISYTSDYIEFIDRKKIYAFGLSTTTSKKGSQYWSVIGISRMNPVCYPKKSD